MIPMFRSSTDLFTDLDRMQDLLDQVFRSPAASSIRSSASGFPVLNVGATPSSIEVMAMAPGVDAASLDITVDRGVLVIAGERRSELPQAGERTSIYANERFAGRFRRVVSLPEDANPAQVDASYRDGVLRISIAKRASSLPRRIEVH